MRLRSVAAFAVVPFAVTSLAACGSSKPADPLAAAKAYAKTAPATIDQNARDALNALKSVHIKANITDSGGATSTDPITMDLSLDTAGNCIGSMTASGYTVNLLGVAGTYYMKANAAFWTAQSVPSTMLSTLADKWVTGSSTTDLSSACNLATMTKDFANDPVSSDHPKVLGTAIVDGIGVVNLQVTDSDGKLNSISIEGAAPHDVIQILSTDGKNKMAFSANNQPVTVATPAGAVDTDTLK